MREHLKNFRTKESADRLLILINRASIAAVGIGSYLISPKMAAGVAAGHIGFQLAERTKQTQTYQRMLQSSLYKVNG